ncbi:MAG: DUF5010 domain-containing protein [Chloroflexi bacterium]|nr:DUF5010 domain-containing protein [Chloroflexota bacterium]
MRLTRRRAIGLAAAGGLVGVVPRAAYGQQAGETGSGWPGQSNLVPAGEPTPTTAFEQLAIGGPPRDPGALGWAQAGPYLPAPGVGVPLNSFDHSQRLATTYYFYWHDLTDPTRLARFSGRFHTPPDPAHYSFLLPETHQREFGDMLDAGLDFVLPVYWGEPGHPGRTTGPTSPHYWSTEGIPAMVEALDRMAAAGSAPLQVGMFYDTTILANADLTTPDGREYFYVNVRDFYSRFPAHYWAAIDDQPIVWLYDTAWVSAFDQSSLDYLSDRFAQDFGGLRLFVVREAQWQTSKGIDPPQPVTSQGLYAWGAAVAGYNPAPELTVAQVGPGFKNTQYCTGGAEHNCFDVDREGGARYERDLQQAVASTRRLLAVETWNEFSEGTDIAETVETGRQYIELTREYTARFASG